MPLGRSTTFSVEFTEILIVAQDDLINTALWNVALIHIKAVLSARLIEGRLPPHDVGELA